MDLNEARLELDALDAEIASLFVRRMRVIDQIRDIKKNSGAPVNQPGREKQVTDRLLSLTKGEYPEELLALYQSIFEISKARQTGKPRE